MQAVIACRAKGLGAVQATQAQVPEQHADQVVMPLALAI